MKGIQNRQRWIMFMLVLGAWIAGPLRAGAQDGEQTPAISGLVDIGGYSLFIDCQGEGALTVVLDGGLGENGRSWLRVQPDLAAVARVCSYDRAGVGGSDPSPITPHTSQVMADELHTLLVNADVPGPYVLVGAGFGGFVARLFAHAHPADVIGMVLIENEHEDFDQHLAESFPGDAGDRSRNWRTNEGVTWELYQMSQDEVRAALSASTNPAFDNRPLVVMTAIHEGLITDETDEQTVALVQLWGDLQADLAALSSNSRVVKVENSGHEIHVDQPEAVIEAVQWVITQAGGSATAHQQSGTWEELSPMLIARSEMPAAVIDGKIYIVGGFVDVLKYGSQLTNSLEVYDPATDTWTELAPMPVGRDHHTLAAYDGQLYCFGSDHFDTATYRYDPATDTWTERAAMPSFRYGASALVLDDAIYIVGGVNRRIPPLLRYDPAADTWTELAAPNVARDHVAGAVLDGKLYAIGGRNVGVVDYTSIEVYDPAADTWTMGPDMNVPRAGFGAAVIDGQIYVAGGEQLTGLASGNAQVVDSVEVFDPKTGTWEIVTTLPRPLHGMPVIGLDGGLYVIGGSALAAGIENHGELFVYHPSAGIAAVQDDSGVVLPRGNPQRTGVYAVSGLPELTGVKWEKRLYTATSLAAPELIGNGLYVADQSGYLKAVDAATGDELWEFFLGGEIVSSVTRAGGVLYAGSERRVLYALDESTGQELWSFDAGDSIWNAPLIVNDTLYLATQVGNVIALDIATQQEKWRFAPSPDFAIWPLAYDDTGLLFLANGERLHALDAATGEERWVVDKEWWNAPAVANGLVYAGSGFTVQALDVATGEEVWSFEAHSDAWSAPAIANGFVYIGNRDQHFYALDAETGELRWQFEAEDWAVSDPVVANGVVYFGVGNHMNQNGKRYLYALDAVTGEQLWSFEAANRLLAAPAVGDGAVYIMTILGDLYALE